MVFLPQIDCIFIGFSLFNRFQYQIFRSNNLFQKDWTANFRQRKKKVRQRNYGKSFEIDFFPFLELNWSHHSIHILRNAQFTHISNSYKSIGWNSNFEYSIYMPKDPTKKSHLIKLQFLIWIQNLKKMCAMCLPGVCRLCISFVKSVFLNEIGKKPYWHSHTIGRYRLESKP